MPRPLGRESDFIRHAELPRRQLSWFLFARVLVVTLLLGGTIIYHLRGASGKPQFFLLSPFLLAAAYYGQAAAAAVFIPRVRRLRFFVQAQIVWDLLFFTGLIYLTGGFDSPFPFLFILVVISAGVFLTRREIFFVASASAILYGSLLDLQYYGYLPPLPGLSLPHQIDGREVFYAVFVNVIGFLLTALLSSILAERLRRSEQALEKREIDYEELERLNRTILASIGSGLMIINPQGRIRSFNAAAEKITGFRLEEVYDRDVRELFPALAVFDGKFRIVERGEASYNAGRAGRQILGYASSLISGAAESPLGLLITFQDLTRLKGMEERLKRADRLAAVGQLASGMAHEIRNPLASISGSVQLLMEGRDTSEEDRRLMRIVVREADRLSALLTDFLVFAHPSPPELSEVDVSLLMDELADMASADPRFGGIEIRREYPSGVNMLLDRQKLHQALWNLAINAAEAMDGKGVVTLGLAPAGGEVYVEDTGPGIPEQIRGKIFNPFFTTKDRGTGLGLATVHKIVEAHGGSIEVAAGRSSGARFTIRLPRESVVGGFSPLP